MSHIKRFASVVVPIQLLSHNHCVLSGTALALLHNKRKNVEALADIQQALLIFHLRRIDHRLFHAPMLDII